MKLCLCNSKEVCEVPCLLVYPWLIVYIQQFCYNFFSVLSLVYLRDFTVRTSNVRSAELKLVRRVMFLDRAIYKSYFFSLFDNLSSNISLYISEAYRFRISRLVFDFSAMCCAMTARNYNSRPISDHASRARYKIQQEPFNTVRIS